MVVRVISRTDTLLFEARKLVNQYAPGWAVGWDRSFRRFGAAHFKTKTITISKHLTEINSDEEFYKIVYHEISHAIAGYNAGHGTAWADVIRSFGQEPNRCHDVAIAEDQYKYVGRCPNGHEIRRFRLTAKAKRVSCAKCSPIYNAAFRYNWSLLR